MYISENQINDAVELILNTREFCGDEMLAICDFCADENLKDWRKVYRIANFKANARWNEYKKEAGVHPRYCL